MDQRIITSYVVLDADEIPQKWFGSTEVQRMENGLLLVEIVKRAFKMVCGCVIEKRAECGDVCFYCRELLEQALSQTDLFQGQIITPKQKDWMSTPCKEHFFRCEVEFCNKGFCKRHGIFAPDGRWYCFEHWQELERGDRIKELIRQIGNPRVIDRLLRG